MFFSRKLKGVFQTKKDTDRNNNNNNMFIYPSSSSSLSPTISNSNENINDFIYLQNATTPQTTTTTTTDMLIKNAYFKDFFSTNNKTFKSTDSNDNNNFIIPHVYETIPSIHYCQTQAPYASSTSTSSNNSYLIDFNYSNTCLLLPKQATVSSTQQGATPSGTIIVLNGQNYYLSPAINDSSQTQLSTCSSTSSTRPLTN